MIPKFDSMSDMLGFIRALPKNANYRNMLINDFGYDVPEDAKQWQMEYFMKYLVQGQYKGIAGSELEKYAVEGTNKIKEKYYVDLLEGTGDVSVLSVGKRGRGRPKKEKNVFPDGTIAKINGFYEGFAMGRLVTRCKNIDRVKNTLTKKYNMSAFMIKE